MLCRPLTVREITTISQRWCDDKPWYYDRALQNETNGDCYMIVPKGIRMYLWFTHLDGVPVCLALVLNRDRSISRGHLVNCIYDKCLSLGTIASGIMLQKQNRLVFCIQYVELWLNRNTQRGFEEQIAVQKALLDKTVSMSSIPALMLSIPDMVINKELIKNSIDSAKFQVHGVRVINREANRIIGTYQCVQTSEKKVRLLVKPEIAEDTYTLYSDQYEGTAIIPSYSKSVEMNKQFRNIKENQNLDALEESDDEEEFEDVSEDRFLKHKNGLCMSLEWNERHNGWVPLEVSKGVPYTHRELMSIMDSNSKNDNRITLLAFKPVRPDNPTHHSRHKKFFKR